MKTGITSILEKRLNTQIGIETRINHIIINQKTTQVMTIFECLSKLATVEIKSSSSKANLCRFRLLTTTNLGILVNGLQIRLMVITTGMLWAVGRCS